MTCRMGSLGVSGSGPGIAREGPAFGHCTAVALLLLTIGCIRAGSSSRYCHRHSGIYRRNEYLKFALAQIIVASGNLRGTGE